jgi:hypothetical protein
MDGEKNLELDQHITAKYYVKRRIGKGVSTIFEPRDSFKKYLNCNETHAGKAVKKLTNNTTTRYQSTYFGVTSEDRYLAEGHPFNYRNYDRTMPIQSSVVFLLKIRLKGGREGLTCH